MKQYIYFAPILVFILFAIFCPLNSVQASYEEAEAEYKGKIDAQKEIIASRQNLIADAQVLIASCADRIEP